MVYLEYCSNKPGNAMIYKRGSALNDNKENVTNAVLKLYPDIESRDKVLPIFCERHSTDINRSFLIEFKFLERKPIIKRIISVSL